MKKFTLCFTASAIAACMGTSQVAFAAAGDTISNIASISYAVDGVTQTAIESSPTGNTTPVGSTGYTAAPTNFVEDQIINFTVATNETVEVDVAPAANAGTPNANTRYLSYTVTNVSSATFGQGSNGPITIGLVANDVANATANPFAAPNGDSTDEFTSTNCKVYSNTTGTVITEIKLAAGASATVYVACQIPAQIAGNDVNGDLVNDDITAVNLVGTVTKDYNDGAITTLSNSATNGNLTVEYVFADANATDTEGDNAAYNGKHSDQSAYRIFKADLTVTKTATIVSDPVCTADPTCTKPKMIPGAIVKYTIVAENALGAAPAQNVTLSDTIDTANVQYQAGTLTTVNSGGNGTTTAVDTAAPTLTSTCSLLNAEKTCTMEFNVQVKY